MTMFTEEERTLKSMVAEFGARRLQPAVPQMEDTDRFPEELFKEAGELGLLGLYVPEEYGGTAFGDVPFMIVSEELAKVSLAFAVAVSCHVGVSSLPIIDSGHEDLKRRLLPGLASGDQVGAFALTEPDFGSDAAALRTTAVRRGDRYVLDGENPHYKRDGSRHLCRDGQNRRHRGRRPRRVCICRRTGPSRTDRRVKNGKNGDEGQLHHPGLFR